MTELGLSRPDPQALPDKGCLRQPTGDMSVVFIHGILSGSESAWTPDGGTSWPRLLEADPEFGAAGLYLFSYRADARSGTYTINDAAASLREFVDYQQILKHRRVVFVAHSLGGIVARRYLVANQADLIERGTVIGLLLVASPSVGAEDANTLRWLNSILGNTQLDGLEFSERNTWLSTLDQDFRNLKDGGRLVLVGKELVEDEAITLKKYLLRSDPVVKPFSASRYFANSDRIAHSDHMSIAKPSSAKADQHTDLINLLRQVMAAGPSERSVRAAEQAERATFIELLRARAQSYVEAIDATVAKLTEESPDQMQATIAHLAGLRAQFLRLHERHIAAIAASKVIAADEIRGDIEALRAEAMQLVESASARISAEMGRWLTRRYFDIPEPGADLEYDAVLSERGRLYEATTDRLRSASYPGDAPPGASPGSARVAFGDSRRVGGGQAAPIRELL